MTSSSKRYPLKNGFSTGKKADSLLGKAVRFLGIEWSEPQWEFGHPTLILEPAVRYSPDGVSVEAMVEDLAGEIATACEADNGFVADEDCEREFKWRRWNIEDLQKLADAGQDFRCGTTEYRVYEVYLKFYRDDENSEVLFDEVIPS